MSLDDITTKVFAIINSIVVALYGLELNIGVELLSRLDTGGEVIGLFFVLIGIVAAVMAGKGFVDDL
ncbi:hypothetical protein [Natronobacterium gregoryi]|uniref:Uncharacterized protein n=2 Tax=Natronobacterium gregoryi TaxID=44930 RepID=L0ANL0_NATGS|nr:hypothetical protein [Natronobacterium gregoryi]AFZ74645.1 hypothetical protein Natgr_3527 [Natronobacterium gregoryi SP2]SFJ31212.1 hypothetical protein SAMN05443661_12164 [Natronobacterium gregoryi]